jgi:hypothetical protein
MAHVGKRIACPSCRGEFLLTPAALLAPTGTTKAANGNAPTPPATGHRPASPPIPAPQHKTETAPTPPPQQVRANTAQFLAGQAQAPTIGPQADGKLPSLLLADTPDAAGKARNESSPVPLWGALLAVAASTAISLILILNDLDGSQSAGEQKSEARAKLEAFYASELGPLQPYQLQLRQAQLAHSRGDRKAEREHYRKVLSQLRAEGRSKFQGLTGTPTGDAELDRLVSILLADS